MHIFKLYLWFTLQVFTIHALAASKTSQIENKDKSGLSLVTDTKMAPIDLPTCDYCKTHPGPCECKGPADPIVAPKPPYSRTQRPPPRRLAPTPDPVSDIAGWHDAEVLRQATRCELFFRDGKLLTFDQGEER